MLTLYKTVRVTADGNTHADKAILSGLSNLVRTVQLIGGDVNTPNILITLRNNETTLAEIPSNANMGFGYWFPIDITLQEQDQLYIGMQNNTTNTYIRNLAIAYTETTPGK